MSAAGRCGGAPGRGQRAPPMRRRSDWLDVLGLGALGTRAGGELHPLVFLEATVTVSLNNGVVNKDVTCSVIRGDEPIALVGVEPLHSTLSHFVLSPTLNDARIHIYGPGAAATACSQKPDSGIRDARCQNFAGAVTRTRISCYTRTHQHYHT